MSPDEGYRLFRGRCRELSVAACTADSTLTLVRGHYWCPIWNRSEPHWWAKRQDGSIFDPTKEQFPSKGLGEYTEFSGRIACAECGVAVKEEEADIDGNYAFCSHLCHGRFIGVY